METIGNRISKLRKAKRIKKKHKNWELVDAESASGEIVKIIL